MKNLTIKLLLSVSAIIVASTTVAMDTPPAFSEQEIAEMRAQKIAEQDRDWREREYGHEETADTSFLINSIRSFLDASPNKTDFTQIKRFIDLLPNNDQELNRLRNYTTHTLLDNVILKRVTASPELQSNYDELIQLLSQKGATANRFSNYQPASSSKI